MLKVILNIGVKEEHKPWLKERILITNRIFLLLMLVTTLNLINSVANNVPLVAPYFIAAYPVGIFSAILIYLGYHVAGRIMFCIVPVFIGCILQGVFQNKGGDPNAAAWGYIILFQIIPFVLLAPHEKAAKRIAVGLNIVMAISYEFFNWLVEAPTPIVLKPEQTFISIFTSLIMILGLMWVIDGIFDRSQKNGLKLVGDLEKEREDQRIAQEKLNKTLEELNAARVNDEKQNWININFANLLSLMRSEKDESKLYDLIVSTVVKSVKANQAMLFIYHSEEQEFRLICAHAYERKKYMDKNIRAGEGLVWECYLEKSNIIMTDVPNNYVSITSGLGEATPRFVILLPLKNNTQVEGVLELASFQMLDKYQIEYLNKAGEALGSFIANQRISAKTKILLQESQDAAEQLKAQEEEMKQSMEELNASQEEMSRKNSEVEKMFHDSLLKEAELNEKIKEIAVIKERESLSHEKQINFVNNYRKTLLGILDLLPHKVFLKDSEGKMVIVNTLVAEAHNMTSEELIGKSDFDFVDFETAQEWRNQELDIIKNGSVSYVHTDHIGGKVRKLKTTKSAFFIPHLNQTGLLGIQTEIDQNDEIEVTALR